MKMRQNGVTGEPHVRHLTQKYNTEVLPHADEGINDIEIYFDCLHSLHTQAVTEAISNYTSNKSLELHHLTFHH